MSTIKENFYKNEIDALLSEKQASKINADDCPLDGDATNCSDCCYGCDYFYLNGECASRSCQNSKWNQISVLEPVYSGNNDEIKSIPVAGWSCDGPHINENSEIIAVVWEDLSKRNTKGVDYKDEKAKTDDYALSCIIETLRSL